MPDSRPMASLDKSISLLMAVVKDSGCRPFSAISAEVGLPAPTAYRIGAALKKRGLLMNGQRGYYVAGRTLHDLGWRASAKEVAAAACRPVLRELSRQTGATIHLGVLDDNMVTYIAKVSVTEDNLFSREGMQLEAYCSAIGKVLLSGLPNAELQRYLASGPFYKLTDNTITDPTILARELCRIKKDDFAIDDAEMAPELHCLAVRLVEEPIPLAISIAYRRGGFNAADLLPHLAKLHKCAQTLRPLLSRCLVPIE